MATITTRAGKGSPLTNTEVDDNFSNLNSAKYESGASPTFANSALLNSATTVSFTLDGASANSKNIYFKGDSSAQMGRIASIGTSLYFQLTDATNYFTINPGSTVINDSSVDHDFRVESNDNSHMLFVDAGNNRVTVGAAGGLTSTFNVSGNAQFANGTGNVGSLSIAPSNDRQLITANSPGNYGDYGVTLKSMRATGGSAYINNIDMTYQSTVLNEEGYDLDFRVESDSHTHMLFVDGGNDRVHFGSSANIENNRVQVTAPKSLVAGIPQGMLGVNDDTAMAQGVGGAIDFTGRYHTNGTYTSLASVEGYKTLSNNGNYDGTLVLKARQHGGDQVDKLRLNSTEAVFNEDGLDTDFRVESDSHTHAIYMNAANGTTAFGSSTPQTAYNFIGVGGVYVNNGNQPSGDFMSIDAEGGAGATKMTFYRYDSSATTYQNRFAVAGETSETVVNESGVDVDFRVESNGNANMLFVDAGANRVGIGTGNPSYEFVVSKDGSSGIEFGPEGINSTTSFIQFYNRSTAAYDTARLYMKSLDLYLEAAQVIALQISTTEAVINQSGTDLDFRVESDTKSHAFFVEGEGSSNRLKIGMGTGTITNPYSQNNFTDLNLDGIWGGVISFKLGGVEYGWIGQRNSGNGDMIVGASSGQSLFLASNGNTSRLELTDAGNVVVNPTGADNDFQVQSDSNSNMLFVDGGNNRVGIGINTPNTLFSVQGAYAGQISNFFDTGSNGLSMYNGAAVLGVSRVSNGSTSLHGPIFEVGRDNSTSGAYNVDKSLFTVRSNETVVNEDSEDYDFRVESNSYSHMLFVDAGDNIVAFGKTQSITGGGMYFNHSNDTRSHLVVSNTETSYAESLFYGNRQNSDGQVFQFRRQNLNVGSISVSSSGTTYNTTSDSRLKKDIETITDGTDKLMAMNPVTHGWKADPEADTVHGFIAQEMMAIVPEAVSGDPEGDEMMSMDYGRITPVLVAALQDAHKKIAELETRLNELEGK